MPEIFINGPVGRLEARYQHNPSPSAPCALILHPHPEHGGTMNNRVTYMLYRAFAAKGFSTLRFNFRGVGRSQGEYDRGEGEMNDAAAALDWMQSINPHTSGVWVAGFSFGAWIGMQLLMRRPEIHRFVSVAPPANMFDFSFLAPCPSSGLIIQGTADEIVPHTAAEKLAEKLTSQRGLAIDYREIEEAGHFFPDHLDDLQDHLFEYIDVALNPFLADVAE